MERKFCSITSRLFSGDPSALFAPLSAFFSVGAIADLTSPFNFQFDTNQVPDSVFWHMTKISITFFNPTSNIAPNLDLLKLMLMPTNLVGSQAQADGGGTININNSGLEIFRTGSDLVNGVSSGWQSVFFDNPVDIPPKWFLRVAIYDDGSGLVLPAGTSVLLRAVQQIVPKDFASME